MAAFPPISAPFPFPGMCFEDFDRYAHTARAWEVETRLMERGGFRADLFFHAPENERFLYARTRLHARVYQEGAAPRGMITFGVSHTVRSPLVWRGHVLGLDDVMLFRDGGELAVSAPPAYDVSLVSFPAELLEGIAHRLRYDTVPGVLRREEVIRLDPESMRQLRHHIWRFESGILSTHGPEPVSLAECLVRVLATAGSPPHPQVPFRTRVTREAAAFARESREEPPTVGDLCVVVGASERTLQAGFKSLYGMGPKRYLICCRLNEVQHRLRHSPRETRIVDAANRSGFWHMGQFARDYRALFGELPSETLRNARGGIP